LIGTRPLGPAIYLAVLLFCCAAASGWGRLNEVWKRLRGVFTLHGVAVALAVAWYQLVFGEHTGTPVTAGSPSLGLNQQVVEAIQHIPVVLGQGIGNFGWLDTPMPRLALAIYFALLGSLLIFAAIRSTFLNSSLVVLLLITSGVLVIAQDINYYYLLRNFGSQGRHVMPLLVGVPLLALRQVRLTKRANGLVIASWAAVMMWSALAALRRYTVGIQPGNQLDMFSRAVWQPDIGVWSAVVALGLSTAACGWCAWRISVTEHDR